MSELALALLIGLGAGVLAVVVPYLVTLPAQRRERARQAQLRRDAQTYGGG